MQIVKCLIFAVILQARIYQAEIIIPTSSFTNSTTVLLDAAVKVVTTCYGDRINTVALVGKLSCTLSRTLSIDHIMPTTMLDYPNQEDSTSYLYLKDFQFQHKLDVFILTVSYDEDLIKLLSRTVVRSIWENRMASFIIIDLSSECTYCLHHLLRAWSGGMLNAKVICYRTEHGAHIFDYNPYTSQAPAPWRYFLVARPHINFHPFTVFNRKLEGNESICINLDFVKTNDLGGHVINVEGSIRHYTEHEDPDYDAHVEFRREKAQFRRLMYIISRTFNATMMYTGIRNDDLAITSEIGLLYVGTEYEVVGQTYPYRWFEVIFASRFRGHKSQLEKILGVIDHYSQIGTGIVYLVTFIFFKFFVRQSFWSTILNLVRITCNTGFTNLPVNTAPRVYLTGLLLFVVTMQGIFQGNLAELLTTNIPVRNVNTADDITFWGYKIYCTGNLAHFVNILFPHDDAEEPFTMSRDNLDCIIDMMNDPLAVCITLTAAEIFDMARNYDLHLSNSHIQQLPHGLMIRYKWHLEEKINELLSHLKEGALLEPWETKANPITREDFQFDKEVRGNLNFKNIELHEVTFAFVILGIGLLCATVAFIVEVAIHRFPKHKKNTVIVVKARHDRDSCAHSLCGSADRTSDNTLTPRNVIQSLPTNQITNELAS